jgi:hypothetical protein
MNEVKFREAIEDGRTHLRAACKALYAALGHANGARPGFEQVTAAATAALQLLAKVETDSGSCVVDGKTVASDSKGGQTEHLGNVRALRRSQGMEGHPGL